MSNYKEKLDKARKNYKPTEEEIRVGFFGDKDIKRIHDALDTIQSDFQNAIEENAGKNKEFSTEKFIELKEEIELIQNQLANGIELKDLSNILTKISEIKMNPIINIPETKVTNKIVVEDWRKEYMFSDSDKSKSVTYVGFVKPDGGWYIERVTKSETSDKARFVFGKSDYVANWGKRLQLNYKYLFEVFNAR